MNMKTIKRAKYVGKLLLLLIFCVRPIAALLIAERVGEFRADLRRSIERFSETYR